jgi:hypothetical protein
MPRTTLKVPFHEKDEAKRLGARWDATKKVWYVPAGIDVEPFSDWIINEVPSVHPFADTVFTTGKPIVWIDSDWPAHIFNPRRIFSIDEIDQLFWIDDCISLLIPNASVISELLNGGAESDGNGARIRRGQMINFEILQPYLPFIAREIIVPMLGDLIPVTSFGSNLANLLTRSCWNELRQKTFQMTGFRCEICGTPQSLECHELWDYYEPLPEYLERKACGVQRLVKLLALCTECHETHHLGLANMRDRSEIVEERLRLYNRWSQDELEDYCQFLNKRSERRSQCNWVLDVSCVAGKQLVLDDRWQLGEDNFYVHNTHTGLTSTMIFGASWSHRGNTYAALDVDLAYLE